MLSVWQDPSVRPLCCRPCDGPPRTTKGRWVILSLASLTSSCLPPSTFLRLFFYLTASLTHSPSPSSFSHHFSPAPFPPFYLPASLPYPPAQPLSLPLPHLFLHSLSHLSPCLTLPHLPPLLFFTQIPPLFSCRVSLIHPSCSAFLHHLAPSLTSLPPSSSCGPPLRSNKNPTICLLPRWCGEPCRSIRATLRAPP